MWILDAYTTSDQYPYSQAVSGAAATDGLLGGPFNYMRNSVKVVIDAYEGTVTYYADLTSRSSRSGQARIRACSRTSRMRPRSLKAHFRYPENLFQVQSYQFANYHVTDPTAFYQRRDFWQISPDPTLQSTGARGRRRRCGRTTS